jgi:5-methylcytosine-specific restriction enzyme A
MTLKPCIACGELSDSSRCTEHRPQQVKASAASRGYDNAWTRLSRKARKLQLFCLDCGSTDDLQADHTPEAWRRKVAGKSIRLCDIDVVCGACNRCRGAARGDAPTPRLPDPLGKAQCALHTERVGCQ